MANTAETLRKVLTVGSFGFGAFAVAAPSAFVSTYGLTATPTTNVFVRLFGTHTLALGALSAATTTDTTTRTSIYQITGAMNVLDALLIATAKSAPAKSRAAGALSAAAFAAVSGYLSSQG